MKKAYPDERDRLSAGFYRALIDGEGNGGGTLDSPANVGVDLSTNEKVALSQG